MVVEIQDLEMMQKVAAVEPELFIQQILIFHHLKGNLLLQFQQQLMQLLLVLVVLELLVVIMEIQWVPMVQYHLH